MKHCFFRRLSGVLFIVVGLYIGPVLAQQYTFVSPPYIPQDQAQQIYLPFIAYINEFSANKFSFKRERNWHTYLKSLRNGNYDLILEEAHIVGWQVRNNNYTPLVRLAGSADVVILKDKLNRNVFSLSDLVGYTVCGPPPPRLSHMLLQLQFRNPYRQPIFKDMNRHSQMIQDLYAHRCHAIVLPLALYALLNNEEVSSRTRIMFQSKPLPSWTLIASPTVPVEIKQRLTAALLATEGRAETRALRLHFLNTEGFINAQVKDYMGYADMLKSYWGFE